MDSFNFSTNEDNDNDIPTELLILSEKQVVSFGNAIVEVYIVAYDKYMERFNGGEQDAHAFARFVVERLST